MSQNMEVLVQQRRGGSVKGAKNRMWKNKVLPIVLGITFNSVWVLLPLLPLSAVLLSWLHGL